MVSLLGLTIPASAAAQAWPAPGGLTRAPSMSVTFRSVYHAYQVRLYDPAVATSTLTGAADLADSQQFRSVNPLYMTVDAAGWNLGGAGQFDTVMSFRYRTDFGTGFHRDTPMDSGIPAVDGRNEIDVLTLFVDWRDAVDGRLDVRLGRQLVLDDLDWYSLDGVKGTAHLVRTASATLDVEAYVGMPVRLGQIFASEPLLGDGFEIDDGPGLAFGGAVFGRFFGDLAVSAAYRQELVFRGDDLDVFRPAAITPEELAEIDAIRAASAGKYALQEHLLGASLGYTIRPAHVDLSGSVLWNLAFSKADRIRAGASFDPAQWVHVQAEYLYVYPRFAADSIFNIFNILPYQRGRLEASLAVAPGLTLELGYFLLAVQNEETASGRTYAGESVAHGPSGGLVYRRGAYTFGANGEASTNFGGRYAYGGNYRRIELFGDASFLDGRVGAVVRAGTTTVQTDWFEGLDRGDVAPALTSYTLDLGARGNLTEWASARFNFIKNFESVLEGSYRVLAVLELRY
ncbi:hypothetical protein L6R52_17650 [Myxococcota bacterium]|nr:hypothetical protein [Myxococcota bacterium]